MSTNKKPKKIVWSGQKCDMCGYDAKYDAPMLGRGTWAYYCEQHKYLSGRNLVLGYEFIKAGEEQLV